MPNWNPRCPFLRSRLGQAPCQTDMPTDCWLNLLGGSALAIISASCVLGSCTSVIHVRVSWRDDKANLGVLATWRSLTEYEYPFLIACVTAKLSSWDTGTGGGLCNSFRSNWYVGNNSSNTPSDNAFNSAPAVLLATRCCRLLPHTIGQNVPPGPLITKNNPVQENPNQFLWESSNPHLWRLFHQLPGFAGVLAGVKQCLYKKTQASF